MFSQQKCRLKLRWQKTGDASMEQLMRKVKTAKSIWQLFVGPTEWAIKLVTWYSFVLFHIEHGSQQMFDSFSRVWLDKHVVFSAFIVRQLTKFAGTHKRQLPKCGRHFSEFKNNGSFHVFIALAQAKWNRFWQSFTAFLRCVFVLVRTSPWAFKREFYCTFDIDWQRSIQTGFSTFNSSVFSNVRFKIQANDFTLAILY